MLVGFGLSDMQYTSSVKISVTCLYSARILNVSADLDTICTWLHVQKVFYNTADHSQVIEVFCLVFSLVLIGCFYVHDMIIKCANLTLFSVKIFVV